MRISIPQRETITAQGGVNTPQVVGIADGAATVADTVQKITGQLLQKNAEERESLTRNRSAKFLAEFGDYQDQLKTEVFNEVKEGKLFAESATEEFKKRSEQWSKTQLLDVDEFTKKAIEPNLPIYQLKAISDVRDAQAQYIKQDFAKGIAEMGEIYSRLAVKNPNDAIAQYFAYLDFAALKAGISDLGKSRLQQDFKEKSYFDSNAFTIDNSSSYRELKELRTNLQNVNHLPDLKPESRRALINSTSAKIERMDADYKAQKREAEQARNERARFIIDAVQGGTVVAPSVLNEANVIAGGNDNIAKIMKGALTGYADNAKMMQAPIQNQAQMVRDAQAAITKETDPLKVTLAQDRYKRLATAYGNNAKMLQNDPWAYDEMRTGNRYAPLDFGGDILAQVANRKVLADGVQSRTGVSAGLIRPEEVQGLKNFVTTMPADQQAQFLGAIAKTDKNNMMGTIHSLAQNDSRLASVALHAALGHKTISGKQTGAILARGFQMMDNKDAMATFGQTSDFSVAFNESFNTKFSGLFLNDVESEAVFKDAVKATYLVFATNANLKGDVLDEDIFDQALAVATGGVVDFNNAPTIPPYGMSESLFEDKANSALDGLLGSLKHLNDDTKKDIKKNAKLIPSKTGGYNLRLNGTLQTDPKTRRLIEVFIK